MQSKVESYSNISHFSRFQLKSTIPMSDGAELHKREYILLCVVNTFFALTAVVLNSVTIHAVRKTSSASLPKNMRILLLNLAFSDLSVGLVVQPFFIIHLTLRFESQQTENAEKVKTTSWVMGILFVCISILGVLALSVDRFLAVHLHLRYQEIVTPKRIVSTLFLSWVVSTILSLLWIAQEYNDFLWIFISVFLATCLITIALLQCKIFCIVRRHRYHIRTQQVQRSERKDETRANVEHQKPSVRSAFYLYFALLVCFLPKIFIAFAMTRSRGTIFHILYLYAATLLFVNSCLNPLIYGWKLRHIRRTIRMMLRNIFVRGTTQAAVEGES